MLVTKIIVSGTLWIKKISEILLKMKTKNEKEKSQLLEKALIVPKKRKAPRGPSAAAKAKRLRDKRIQAERKATRGKVRF